MCAAYPKPALCPPACICSRRLLLKKWFLLLFCVCCLLRSYAAGQGFTVKLENVSLEQAFKVIKKQTGCFFSYTADMLVNTAPVTIDATNSSLEDILRQCFKAQPLTYRIDGQYVMVRNKTMLIPETFDIIGYVSDEAGVALSGATIHLKNTGYHVAAAADGRFQLKGAGEGGILIVSLIGYETKEVAVSGRQTYQVRLKASESKLDEVQVIAYGTTTRRLSTGNVSTVKAEEIARQPVANPVLALEGRVPGMFITQNTGVAGGGISVQIRGLNSISQSNEPLYIIDGVPYTSQLLPGIGYALGVGGEGGTAAQFNGSALSFINPADIESIDVLKDADATSIYGSRGANGVVLITTKKGKAGNARVDINVYTGMAGVARKTRLMNREQYLEMRHEAYKNDGVPLDAFAYDLNGTWDTTRNTDWQNELVNRTAHITDGQVALSGGTANVQYVFGCSYRRETPMFPGAFSDRKTSGHFSITTASANRRFRAQLSGNYIIDNNNLPTLDISSTIITSPVAPRPFTEDGGLNWGGSNLNFLSNPYRYLFSYYNGNTNNLVANSVVSYELVKGLMIKSSFGYTNLQVNELNTNTIASQRGLVANPLGSASFSFNNIRSWIAEPQLLYNYKSGAHTVNVLTGGTFQENKSQGQVISGEGYTNDAFLGSLAAAATINKGTVNYEQYRYNAFYGRISYNYEEKYLVNLTARRDGSSRFGPDRQFGNFGSAGIGWVFSKEKFVEKYVPIISFGKLRASYGTVGNQPGRSYGFLELYNFSTVAVPYQGGTGLTPNNIFAPDFSWEVCRKAEAGLELGLWKDRLIVTASYFRNRTGNQLILYNLPNISGFGNITANLPATVQNAGWEFTLNTVNLKGKSITWSSTVNFTATANKLIDFKNLQNNNFFKNTLIIGQPITVKRVYHLHSVDAATGIYQFTDSKGNLTFKPVLNTDNTTYINTAPVFYGGLQNNVKYKGFQLDVFFHFVKQMSRNNLFSLGASPGFGPNNWSPEVLNRWQKSGDIAPIQKFTSLASGPAYAAYSFAQMSDYAYSDASYIRLKNVSLSYQLPGALLKNVRLQQCRLYIQGQNLLTITGYKGGDPEQSAISVALPLARIWTAGIQITF